MRTHEFVCKEAEKVLLLLGLGTKEVGEEGESLSTDIVERVKGKCLKDLEDGEEVLLEPILKVPNEEVRIGDIWVEEWLIAEVSAEGCGRQVEMQDEWVSARGEALDMARTHRNLRAGPPPPTHQSTTQRMAFRPSSLPPFARPRWAMERKLSRAGVLWTGLAWTRRVRALSLSERVPVERMVLRKWASEAVCAKEEDE